MGEVGIRMLKQNASEVVSRATSGEVVVVTDRGRKVAQLTAIPASPLQRLLDAGIARAPKRSLLDLEEPEGTPGLSNALSSMRNEERY